MNDYLKYLEQKGQEPSCEMCSKFKVCEKEGASAGDDACWNFKLLSLK